jgi:hypothetical protein
MGCNEVVMLLLVKAYDTGEQVECALIDIDKGLVQEIRKRADQLLELRAKGDGLFQGVYWDSSATYLRSAPGDWETDDDGIVTVKLTQDEHDELDVERSDVERMEITPDRQGATVNWVACVRNDKHQLETMAVLISDLEKLFK